MGSENEEQEEGGIDSSQGGGLGRNRSNGPYMRARAAKASSRWRSASSLFSIYRRASVHIRSAPHVVNIHARVCTGTQDARAGEPSRASAGVCGGRATSREGAHGEGAMQEKGKCDDDTSCWRCCFSESSIDSTDGRPKGHGRSARLLKGHSKFGSSGPAGWCPWVCAQIQRWGMRV